MIWYRSRSSFWVWLSSKKYPPKKTFQMRPMGITIPLCLSGETSPFHKGDPMTHLHKDFHALKEMLWCLSRVSNNHFSVVTVGTTLPCRPGLFIMHYLFIWHHLCPRIVPVLVIYVLSVSSMQQVIEHSIQWATQQSNMAVKNMVARSVWQNQPNSQ